MLLPEEEQTEPPIIFGNWLISRMKQKYVEWRDSELQEV